VYSLELKNFLQLIYLVLRYDMHKKIGPWDRPLALYIFVVSASVDDLQCDQMIAIKSSIFIFYDIDSGKRDALA
jgi:hypothetical protein